MNALDRRELLDLEDRDAEILAAERADQHHDPERLYVPTAAGRAYIFTGDSGEAAGKSTGADLHRKAGSVPRETHRDLGGPACSPAATVSATTATSS